MNKKSGISLVVLVIMIIIILILSSVVFLDFNSSKNSISEATEARIKSDITTFKDELNMNLAKNPRIDLTLVSIDDDRITEEERVKKLLEYIPGIEDARINSNIDYASILTIQEGNLKLYDELTLYGKGINIPSSIKNVILENITTYTK